MHIKRRVVNWQRDRRQDPPEPLQRTGDPGPEVLVLILSKRGEQFADCPGELLDSRVLNEQAVTLPCGRDLVELGYVLEAGHVDRSKLIASIPAGILSFRSRSLSALRSAKA